MAVLIVQGSLLIKMCVLIMHLIKHPKHQES